MNVTLCLCTYCTLGRRPVLSSMSPFRSGAGRVGREGGHRGTRVHIVAPPQCRARRCSRSVGPAASQPACAAPPAKVGSRPLLPPLPPALQESNDITLSLQQWATCYGWFTALIVPIHYVRKRGGECIITMAFDHSLICQICFQLPCVYCMKTAA